MSWPKVKLGDICRIEIGKTPPRAKSEYWGIGYPFLSIKDMNQGKFMVETKEEITDAALQQSNYRLVPKGTLLMSFKLSIGKLGITKVDMYTNEAIAALYVDESKVSKDYLYHALQSIDLLATTDRAVMGATLNKRKLALIPVPLPSLDEQKLIAAILDKADEIKQSTEEAEIFREKLAEAQFFHLFGDPAINQMEWRTTEISELIGIQGGFAFKSRDYVHQGVKLLKISNVHFRNVNWDKVDYLPEGYLDKHQQFSLNENDIVIALTRPIIQSLNNVKVVKIRNTDLPCLLNQRVARFQINEEIINPYFLFFFLLTPYFKNKIVEFCSTSLQPNVSTKQIGEIPIYLPPITLQNQFANFVVGVEKLPSTTMLAEDTVNSVIHDILS